MSRLITDLVPELQVIYPEYKSRLEKAGIDHIVTCTSRTPAEQMELFKIGRELREGKWIVIAPKKCVTWILNSKHILRKAFDVCILINGKLLWNPELDADKDGVPEYTEAGLIGQSLGLRWGGRFKDSHGKPTPDAPHYEL
jgi:peptidoglycan L-alanyl-D-glutamate endopeptidase CwlK